MKRLGLSIVLCGALAAGSLAGCASATSSTASASSAVSGSPAASVVSSATGATSAAGSTGAAGVLSGASASVLDTSDMFTSRDMEQTADTSNATKLTVTSGQDLTISEEGVYVISGTATDCTIMVNADSAAKVQLVLDGVTITNSTAPAIYVVSADKVFVTTASGSTNELSVTGAFSTAYEDTVDGVIFAKDDLVLNGLGTLTINSSDNGIVGKDDVKVTGGSYNITAQGHGIQGKDSVAIADGTFTIKAGTDAIHSNNSDDASLGSVYISGGQFNLRATSDGIGGTSAVQIDGGTFDIEAEEGIEGTYVQINDGTINIQATDDGINATTKSTAYSVVLEINGGETTVSMAAGDTDALDSNGDLYINGGTVNISAQSPFDYDGRGALNGGTVIVNGQQVSELANAMMGGGMMGGPGQQGSMGSMGPMSGSGQQGSMGSSGSMGGRQGGQR